MSAAPRNIVNLQFVGKGYGGRAVLADVSLGISAGERIGVVGRNGDGKSTLLRLLAGLEHPDAGAVTRANDLELALIGQGDELDGRRTVREQLVGGRPDHEWAADPAFRAVLDGLLGALPSRAYPAASTRRWARCRAGSDRGWRWRGCCWAAPSCCCWTSRPTTWTWRASPGWRAI